MLSYFQRIIQCFLWLYFKNGSCVFGVDEVKSVSLMEGDFVTLLTDITELQRDHLILWMFGPKETRIAEIHKKNIDMYNSNEIFGDRLNLDSQTGSLTITNITITHSGLYKLTIISNRGTSYKRFNVTVYAPLPIPVIIRNSSQCSSSSSNCSLLCSVLNMRDVSLSWYKGNSLLSSISVSDLNIRLSLPLEVEYHDNNTYRCVLNNTITNQTQHLNITQLCQPCPENQYYIMLIVVVVAIVLLLLVVAPLIYHTCKKFKRSTRGDETLEEEILYTETVFTPGVGNPGPGGPLSCRVLFQP